MGGKVAKIDFFRVGIHAKNGHLSADKVFILKKMFTPDLPSYCVDFYKSFH